MILARPEHKNAINRETADELFSALAQFESDPEMKRAHLALYLCCKESLRMHKARQARNKAAVLAALVPGHCVLHLFLLKDEGIMFYYGRRVVRLHAPAELPW